MNIPKIKIPKIKIKLNIIKLLLIYSLIGTIFTFAVLIYLNINLFKDEATNVKYIENKEYIPEALLRKQHVLVPQNARNISFSYDHNYMSYISSGTINIKDLCTGKLIKQIKEDGPITTSFFVNDRNIILYFILKNKEIQEKKVKVKEETHKIIDEENLDDEKPIHVTTIEEENTVEEDDIADVESLLANQLLLIKTYAVDTDEKTEQIEMNISHFIKIRQVEYSSLTNLIYVNVESLQDDKLINNIYRINIMKKNTKYQSGKIYKKMVLLNNEDKLIVEDDKNNIYISKSLFRTKKYKKFELLGRDNEDNFYITPIDFPNKILKVRGKEVVEEKTIIDTSPHSVYSNNEGVFLIFKENIWPLAHGGAYGNIKLDKQNIFVDLFDNVLYEINVQGELVQTLVRDRMVK